MNKLKLHLDNLRVESFSTAPSSSFQGTVDGHANATFIRCNGQYTVDYPLSCDLACGSYKCTLEGSCAYSCTDCTRLETCQGGVTCAVSCDPTCFTCPASCDC